MKKYIILITVFLLFALTACSGMGSEVSESYISMDIGETDYRLLRGDEALTHYWHEDIWNPMDADELIVQSGLFPYFSEEKLMETASLVARGRMVGRSAPFFIVNDYFDYESLFTDYTFHVYDILRGGTYSREILVRVMGGVTYEMTLLNEQVPEFQRGAEYLLFLAKPGFGILDAPGYYYYIIGGEQGIFPLSVSNMMDGEAVFSQYGEMSIVFEMHELVATIEEVNKAVPVRSIEEIGEEMRSAFLQNIENDFLGITEEEIDEVMNRQMFPARIR